MRPKKLVWPGSHMSADAPLVVSMRCLSSILWKSRISMAGLAWLSWRICVLQRFIICPNFPQTLFKRSFARIRSPGLYSMLLGSRRMPSFCLYIVIHAYRARHSSVLTHFGCPLVFLFYCQKHVNVVYKESTSRRQRVVLCRFFSMIDFVNYECLISIFDGFQEFWRAIRSCQCSFRV